MSDAAQQTLPFNEERQTAILGHLLVNEKFFKQGKDRIKPSWFQDVSSAKVLDAKIKFYEKYGRIPTKQELEWSEGFRLENQGGRSKMVIKVQQAMNLTTIYGLDTLLPELTQWLHARIFQDGVHQSENLFNNAKFSEAYAYMDTKLNLIKTTTFDNNLAFDFENYAAFFEKREQQISGALSFGISQMDRLLLPLAGGKGSLLPGDTTLLLAPTNIGKTTSMITIAAHNVRQCKSVLFLTHEGVDDDIVEKVWCSILNINKAQLYEMAKDPKGRQIMDVGLQYIRQFFKYIPMNRAGLNVEEVAAVIRKEQESRVAEKGRGWDMLVDDYPAKLGSENMKFGQFQKRNLDEYVYNYFVQLALEYKFHSLLAIQGNRTSGKINRGQKGQESRLLVPEDVNESYGPCQIATNVITINRDPLCEALGYVIYYLGKSRSNEKGWAVVCKSNYKNAITHSDSMGCTYYRGDIPLGDQLEDMFRNNRGNEIVPQKLHEGRA